MKEFKIPGHYDPSKAGLVYRVDYAGLANQATAFKKAEGITNAATDKYKIAVMPIDMQITFGIPGHELYVQNAPEDTKRFSEFIYRNLGYITKIFPTMDTHTSMQIFHSLFFIDENGDLVKPNTVISSADLKSGKYAVNPAVAGALNVSYTSLKRHVIHYTETLEKNGKYSLIIWDYHAMLGGIGHALIPLFEEAIFFHTIARNSQPGIEIKGGNPLTENYSVLSPEVLNTADGSSIAQKNARFIETLLNYDIVIIGGQAKSHCVAFSIEDLLTEIQAKDPALASKVYLLEDCTSPVIIPNVIDFTQQGNQAFKSFESAGMHLVKSITPIDQWPGVDTGKLM
ncbi:MAG: isochorismatase [Candidatus Peribacteria bacterium]|jgi:nicotinamidase-related amidase|nr:isochorismatase [Candidatus Peribacteria bacterium]